VKAAKSSVGRLVDQPDPHVRFYLFHGPDDAQSRGLGERLLGALGATRFIISGALIKSDPASLADEAAAMSLFGGPRVIWIEPAGEDIVAGVEALLAAGAAESPVIAVWGTATVTRSDTGCEPLRSERRGRRFDAPHRCAVRRLRA
jgi:DNA polymerase-3 subunit delta